MLAFTLFFYLRLAMTHGQLRSLLTETKLSPEQLALRLGVSNMTLRRWNKLGADTRMAKSHEHSVMEGIYQLMIEGHLNSSSKLLPEVIENSTTLSFQAVLKTMGVSEALLNQKNVSHEDLMTRGSLSNWFQRRT